MSRLAGRLCLVATSLETAPPDLWLGIGSRLCCAVHAWDPDGRSVRSDARAARYGAQLVDAVTPALDAGAGEVERVAQQVGRTAMLVIGGMFEPLLVAALPDGLWVAGRGRMEVLEPGAPVAEALHPSDSLYWSRPGAPEPTARVVTCSINDRWTGPPLRSRLLPPVHRTLLLIFDVPGEALRAVVSRQGSRPHEIERGLDVPMLQLTYFPAPG